MNASKTLSFERFELDFDARELRDQGKAVKVEPQVFDLLWFLACRAGKLVSKDEIIEHVWKGRFISDAAISTRINGARVAIKDSGAEQRIIRTVPRRGFRFLAEVSDQNTISSPETCNRQQSESVLLEDDAKPAMAVMPLKAMGADEDLVDLAEGMRIDIQNALIKVSGLFLTAVGSVNAVRDKDALEAAEALGVRYLLQGQLRRSGSTLRLSVQLLDASKNRIVLSEQFDHGLDNAFAVLDEVAAEVLETINVALVAGEPARIWHKTLKDIESLSVFYRGVSNFFQMTGSSLSFARAEFERIAHRHPDVSIGYTWIALTHWFDFQRGWSEDKDTSKQLAQENADKAVGFPDTDGQAHTVLSHVYLLDGEFSKALEAGKNAVANRPSCTNANAFFANVLHYCDRNADALRHISFALDRSPFAPAFFQLILIKVLTASGNLDAASKQINRLMSSARNEPQVILAACLLDERRGKTLRASEHAETLRKLDPTFRIENYLAAEPYRNIRTKRAIAASLKNSGLPE